MSDPGRPALPDPQQDRHVAFPELTPQPPSEGTGSAGSTGAAGPTGSPPGLSPDAWARHEPKAGPRPTPPLPPPSIRSTPPTRPAPRARRPAWIPFAAVVGVFLVMGNLGTSHDASFYSDGGYSEQQWSGSDPDDVYDLVSDGWVVSVVDGETKPPLPPDSAVSPVPPDTEVLRVEVVAQTEEPVSLQISSDTGLDEETTGAATPLVRHVHSGTRMRTVEVRVSTVGGSAAPVQCRIYAGATLVALSTGPVGVSCTARWT